MQAYDEYAKRLRPVLALETQWHKTDEELEAAVRKDPGVVVSTKRAKEGGFGVFGVWGGFEPEKLLVIRRVVKLELFFTRVAFLLQVVDRSTWLGAALYWPCASPIRTICRSVAVLFFCKAFLQVTEPFGDPKGFDLFYSYPLPTRITA